ncbi:50S ribosomal protein L30 [Trichlorobacter lovleyi]|jgi:LSU ribosomal protein L30P|uniref:Large ribosomal subunit protein uL30 n=1 Tax=Trichlorobacter lovleyi (strain ATCC BAA-1151 / DSM 17278 / SZ) TaxID=398767 RepID=RL30_TRIL1|nr:50S ribosomal protein L30 [Trichlorobacter lovleyi]B3E848.1 RecName: Full=Large ribosomal subunit protein uL30; AltName: Full=50S ribosomal protein L30 [Trichlorobacter lovleyi SZ]ACD95085.1 ribosomal protein L30 [Trichlorobacter lovleyi SZ]
MSNMLEITLIKSTIGATEKQCAVVRGLGLRRLHQTVTLQDSPETRGMISKINHMLKVK